ncbi:MAG: D-alanyl-D-alanine carboxypeptidase family protein [Erythrobacter sp.]|nr:D-alanyl-D-alanine carboxypeptidase family protein [Erythrobacter sp.]
MAAPVRAQDDSTPRVPSAEEAPIAMLVDVTSGQILHERAADRRFVPASITKVMTLYHAFELIEEGALDPRQVMTMRPEAWREWNGRGSTLWIGAKDRIPVEILMMGIANVSANDASIMLAEGQAGSLEGWLAGMNARTRELGMEDSHFGTPNGWPDEGATFTSARDLVTLATAMIARHPRKFARYIGKPGFGYNGIAQNNHDPLIGRVRGADGIKTGYTNEAGFGYLGTAARDGQRLVLVVAGADRSAVRARAARDYIEWGFSAFERKTLFDAGEIVARAQVQRGSARSVPLAADSSVAVSVPKGRAGELTARIVYDGPLRAPIAAGDEVATLVVEVPGMEPARIMLQAQESVGEAGVLARLWNGLAGWFA